MAGTDAFKVEGVIVEVLSKTTYRVELSNGHCLLSFLKGKLATDLPPLAAGDRIRLQLSPYDLSVGRIIAEAI